MLVVQCFLIVALFGYGRLESALPIVLKPLSEAVSSREVPPSQPAAAPLYFSTAEEDIIAQEITQKIKSLGFKQTTPLRVGLRRCLKKREAERLALRRFLLPVTPGTSGLCEPTRSDLEIAATLLLSMLERKPMLKKFLSVDYYKRCQRIADVHRYQMVKAFEEDSRLSPAGYPQSDSYEKHKRLLIEYSANLHLILKQQLGCRVGLNEERPGSSVFVFRFKHDLGDSPCDVILKIPNPYACYKNHFRIKMSGRGGENHSPKRNVQRVATAECITQTFYKDYGVRAPQKRLFLRPGAFADGLLNDATCIVLAERVVGSKAEGDLNFLSEEQFTQLETVQHTTGVGDFHPNNVFVDRSRREIILFDTELNCASSSPWSEGGLGHLRFHHTAKFKASLCSFVCAEEVEDNLTDRLVALAMLLPKENSVAENAVLFRAWLDEYVLELHINGYLSEAGKTSIQKYWDDVTFEGVVAEPTWTGKYPALEDARRRSLCRASPAKKGRHPSSHETVGV